MQRRLTSLLLCLFIVLPVQAHDVTAVRHSTTPAVVWSFEPWVIGPLVLSAFLYALGIAKLWRRAGVGRGLPWTRVAAFIGGWLALVLALVSPLDALGGQSFALHMVQHEVLMLIAAPLFVIGRPLAAWTWALPAAWRWSSRVTRQPLFARLWRWLSAPFNAWLIHAVVLWLWHAPALFNAAVVNPVTHTWQHVSFLAAALLYWWSVIGRDSRITYGGAILSLLSTTIHGGLLSALLTFAPRAWYGAYGDRPLLFGLDPLMDQQLGGILMWVPAGMLYLCAALILTARWLMPARQPGA